MRAAPLYTNLRGCGGQSAICVGRTLAVPHAARLVAVPSLLSLLFMGLLWPSRLETRAGRCVTGTILCEYML